MLTIKNYSDKIIISCAKKSLSPLKFVLLELDCDTYCNNYILCVNPFNLKLMRINIVCDANSMLDIIIFINKSQ